MKQSRTSKILCLILVLMMALSFMPGIDVVAASDTMASSNGEVQFVMVTDVSKTMKTSDTKGYSKDAIQMFVDMFPVENASAGLITFGHENANAAYSYSDALEPNTPTDRNFVHTISDMKDLSIGKSDIKSVVKNIEWNGGQTLIDAALLSGVDMLTKSGASKDRGCVIMLTDGEYKSHHVRNTKDMEKAISALKAQGWYVYCIELDYASSASSRNSNHTFLTSEITDKCNGETYQVTSASDVGHAFMEIINNFYDTGTIYDITTDGKGYGEKSFSVPDLTSETNITINGSTINGIQLLKGDTVVATYGKYSGDKDETSYNKSSFAIDSGKIYCNVKMILPEAGEWIIKVHGDANSKIYVNNISFSDLSMKSTINPDGNTEEMALKKADQISATLALMYDGKNIKKGSLGNSQAYLCVTNNTADEEMPKTEMLWNEETNQFETFKNVSELGKAGVLTIWIEINYANGESKQSKAVTIYTANEEVVAVAGANISDNKHYVRSKFEFPIDNLFKNPDNDELAIIPVTDAGENASYSVTLNDDKTALIISTGDRSGIYTGSLLVYDADMGKENAVSIPISLEVLNHKMESKNIANIDMTSLYISKYDAGETDFKEFIDKVDLNDYFSDKDQLEIQFTINATTDSDGEEIVSYSVESGILTLTSQKVGTATVTVSAIDDDGKMISEEFEVKTTSQSKINSEIRKRLIERLGIGTVIMSVVIAILIIGIGLMVANTRIRGTWNVEISTSVGSYSLELNTKTDVLRRYQRKGTLTQVIDLDNLPISDSAVMKAQNVNSELSTVILFGVIRGNGCKILPKDVSKAKLFINGQERNNKQKLAYGGAEIVVNTDTEETITVRLSIM